VLHSFELSLSLLFLSVSAGVLAVVMGMRFRKSGKLMPAGIMAALRYTYKYTIFLCPDVSKYGSCEVLFMKSLELLKNSLYEKIGV